MKKLNYKKTQPSLSTLVCKTLPSNLDHASFTSSTLFSLQTATNDDPVPDSPEAIAPA